MSKEITFKKVMLNLYNIYKVRRGMSKIINMVTNTSKKNKIKKTTKAFVLLYFMFFTIFTFLPRNIKNISATQDTINAQGFAGGDGLSKETAFLVATAEQLDNVRNYLGDSDSSKMYYFKQTADIDLTNFLKDSIIGWDPIGYGNASGEFFYGVYDGGMYEIKGLWSNQPLNTYSGLFGFVGSSEIKNIKLTLSEQGIIGGEIAGGIVAQATDVNIINCFVSGNIKVVGPSNMEEMYVGGIVGQINSGTIEKCFYKGIITDNYIYISDTEEKVETRGLGGISGYMKSSSIKNCYANVSIIKEDEHDLCYTNGGITGVYSIGATITNCLAIITTDCKVYPITSGVLKDWIGFGDPISMKINGSYAYYTNADYIVLDMLNVLDSRGLSKDEYSHVITLQELNKRETYIGENGVPWDFTAIWGFDRDGNILLRSFGNAYDKPSPLDLTWLWITIACIMVAIAAAFITFTIYRHKKPLIVKETETIVETRHVYIGDESQPLPNDLTPKEREVAALLLEWKSRKDIMEILALSANAVNFHIKNIYEKCECHSHKEFIVKFGTEKHSLNKKD